MFSNLNVSDLIGTTVFIACIILVTFFLLRITGLALARYENKNGKRIHIRFLYNVVRLFIFLLAISAVGSRFDGFKSTMNTILASSGIIALGVSMAAQESLSNIIDGIFISMFRPFNIGDRVTLPEKNNLTGTVTEMNLRHTVIQTFSNTSYIIPNSVMSSSIVDNSNYHNRMYAYPIDVSVAYDTDIDLAMKLMVKAITEHPRFVDPRTDEQRKNDAPMVTPLLREFGDSGMLLRCMMYVDNVAKSFQACSEVRIALKKLFDENGIVIPFTTIHLDN